MDPELDERIIRLWLATRVYPSLRSGFRLTAQTPRTRLKQKKQILRYAQDFASRLRRREPGSSEKQILRYAQDFASRLRRREPGSSYNSIWRQTRSRPRRKS